MQNRFKADLGRFADSDCDILQVLLQLSLFVVVVTVVG